MLQRSCFITGWTGFIAEIVLKELGSIPEPQQEGYGFYYCDKTGDVKALKIGCERESFKRLKQPWK